jgi:hypothetical protein
VRSEQRRKSAKAPSALRVGLKRVRLRRCSFVTYTASQKTEPVSRPVRCIGDEKASKKRSIYYNTIKYIFVFKEASPRVQRFNEEVIDSRFSPTVVCRKCFHGSGELSTIA